MKNKKINFNCIDFDYVELSTLIEILSKMKCDYNYGVENHLFHECLDYIDTINSLYDKFNILLDFLEDSR